MIRKGFENRSSIYLTFDDGPDPRFTPLILDILELFDIRATFFVLGQSAARYPHLLKRIQDRSHDLGNHTDHHCHPWLIGSRRAREEVREAQQRIADICGEAPRLFRPPFGRLRPAMLDEAARLGMETVLWSRSAIDWGRLGSVHGTGRRLSRVLPGDIVLCHDAPRVHNRPDVTFSVLPAFIQDCLDRQLRFAGVGELLARPSLGQPRSLSPSQSV